MHRHLMHRSIIKKTRATHLRPRPNMFAQICDKWTSFEGILGLGMYCSALRLSKMYILIVFRSLHVSSAMTLVDNLSRPPKFSVRLSSVWKSQLVYSKQMVAMVNYYFLIYNSHDICVN